MDVLLKSKPRKRTQEAGIGKEVTDFSISCSFKDGY
jgi:hypothetical protein